MTKENLVVWLKMYNSAGDLPGKSGAFPVHHPLAG